MLRTLSLVSCTLLIGGGLACSGADAPVTGTASSPPSSGESATEAFATPDSLAGLWEVRIDPVSETGTIALDTARSTASLQARNYDLDIAEFQQADSLKLVGLEFQDDRVVVRLQHRHPFPAPDFSQPITGLNRADLGYTGRLLVLSAADSVSFYGGGVICDPTFLANADGYVKPGDLLRDAAPEGGFNTFAYKLLVDDAAGTRVGFPPGPPTGNYQAGSGGWQRGNITGPEGNNGWTGYDYLHGGQASEMRLEVDLEALEANDFSFTTAILIKYTDPRGNPPVGGELRDRRFPPATTDPLAFAYRLPFSALDNSVLRVPGPIRIGAYAGATATIDLTVRDWDAGATESTDLLLDDQPNVALIQRDAGGYLNPSIAAPEFAASVPNFTFSTGNGRPGTELEFSTTLTNVEGTAAPGRHWAMVRVIDPEDAHPDRDMYHFGVDPLTLVADPARAMTVRTYLPIPIDIASGSWQRQLVPDDYLFPGSLEVDDDGNLYVSGGFDGQLDFEATPLSPSVRSRGTDWYVAKYNLQGDLLWLHTLGSEGSDPYGAMTRDEAGDIILVGTCYGAEVDLDPTIGQDLRTLPGLNYEFMIVKLTSDGDYVWGNAWGGSSSEFSQGVVARGGYIYLGGYVGNGTVDFDPGPGAVEAMPVNRDGFALRLTSNGQYDRSGLISGIEDEAVYRVQVDAGDRLYLSGYYRSPDTDFNPGGGTTPAPADPASNENAFVCAWSGSMLYQWHGVLAGDGNDNLAQMRAIGDQVLMVGSFDGDLIDVDPGVGTVAHLRVPGASSTAILVAWEAATGSYNWSHRIGLDQFTGFADLTELLPGIISISGGARGVGDLDPSAGEFLLNAPGSTQPIVLRFTTDGEWVAGTRWESLGGAAVGYCAPLPYGELASYGQYAGTMDFDAGPDTLSRTAPSPLTGFVMRTQLDGSF